MNIGLTGTHPASAARARALRLASGVDDIVLESEGEAPLDEVDVLFVADHPSDRYRIAQDAIRKGVAVFLEWPPAPSLAETEHVAALSEESSVVVGVSRPLRRIPSVREGLGRLISVDADFGEGFAAGFAARVSEAADLAAFLAGTFSASRIDGEVVRGAGEMPQAAAFGIRFQNGGYATIRLRRFEKPARLEASWHGRAGGGHLGVRDDTMVSDDPGKSNPDDPAAAEDLEAAVARTGLLASETSAFLQAVRARGRPPVSIFDAIHSFRLAEGLMRRIR